MTERPAGGGPIQKPVRAGYTIDGDRLWAALMRMAEIGATPQAGVCRLALSEADGEARDLFATWCREAGCAVTWDAAGNMFARRPGRDPDAAPVAIGSHLDSQPTGGKFDGAFGVLAALEVVRTLNDRDITTDRPIEVINWTNEEGVRYPPVMLGSGTFTGVHPLEETLAKRDVHDVSYASALDRIGYRGVAPMGEDHPLAAFLEAHIEQGPVLEDSDLQVGIVTGAQGIWTYEGLVVGEEAHAGTTPMARRRDALAGAGDFVRRLSLIARAFDERARLTVGDLRVYPCARNTVPGRVAFSVDMRHPDASALDELDRRMRAAKDDVEQAWRVAVDLQQIAASPPVTFDPAIIAGLRDAAQNAGLASCEMLSGAGHDACHIAQVTRTGMVFVPCRGGVSHKETESAEPDDLAAGTEVLYRSALQLAGGAP